MRRWQLAAALVALAALFARPATAGPKFQKIFDGSTLSGWKLIGGSGRGYVVENVYGEIFRFSTGK